MKCAQSTENPGGVGKRCDVCVREGGDCGKLVNQVQRRRAAVNVDQIYNFRSPNRTGC